MKLSKNEKRTLKLLLSNSRMSDSEIASKLNISSQAVGKIRRKLETTIINGYTLDVDYAKLDIKTFAIALAKLTKEGVDKGKLHVENCLQSIPNVINVYRLPKGSCTHLLLFAFNDIADFDDFFHSAKNKDEIHMYLETQELLTFSHNSLIKSDPIPLFEMMIDQLGSENLLHLKEMESFKRKIIKKKVSV